MTGVLRVSEDDSDGELKDFKFQFSTDSVRERRRKGAVRSEEEETKGK
jgi:hypothetical protein